MQAVVWSPSLGDAIRSIKENPESVNSTVLGRSESELKSISKVFNNAKAQFMDEKLLHWL